MLIDDPQVWPDEALYGDIARNIAFENRLGTDLLSGMIKGIENHAYWIPPFFMYTLGFWIKLFGTSIETQRLFSVFLGVAFILTSYQITKSIAPSGKKLISKIIPFLTTLLIITDPAFIKASRLSRPEMLVVTLVGLALFFYLQVFKQKKRQGLLLRLSGLLIGLAVTTHLIAVGFAAAFSLHLLYCYWKKILKLKQILSFLVFFSIPVVVWLLSIFPNYDLLFDQLNIISNSRTFTIPWYVNVSGFPLMLRLNYFIYIAVSLFFILFTLRNKKPENILLSFILVSSWIFITLGEIFWYTVYPIVFTYLALSALAGYFFKTAGRKTFHKLGQIILAVTGLFLFFSNISDHMRLQNTYPNKGGYSQQFINQIRGNIPAGKTVFLSSIPDAYFAFEPGRNKLFEYPAFFADKEDFKKVMAASDYVIFSNYFSPVEVSGYQDRYMSKNMESFVELSSPYRILVIKLKDKSSRVEVD